MDGSARKSPWFIFLTPVLLFRSQGLTTLSLELTPHSQIAPLEVADDSMNAGSRTKQDAPAQNKANKPSVDIRALLKT